MIQLALTLAFAAALLFYALRRLGRLGETHHGYYGILIAFVGFYLGAHSLVYIGGVMLCDDAIQHVVQLRWPTWRVSLLYWLYALTLAKIPLVQRLNRALDGDDV